MKKLKPLIVILIAFVSLLILACQEELPIIKRNNFTVDFLTNEVHLVNKVEINARAHFDTLNHHRITESGFCYDTIEMPTIENNTIKVESDKGILEANIIGLKPNRTIHVRAYAKTSYDIFYSHAELAETDPCLPILDSIYISEITDTTAISTSKLISDNGYAIKEMGVCWSTKLIPTISDNVIKADELSDDFVFKLLGLSANEKYYVRSFATNEGGIAYGPISSFLAAPGAPTQTVQFIEFGEYSAKVKLDILNDGGVPIIECGICYGTNSLPVKEDYFIPYSSYFGPITSTISNLDFGVDYFVRSYVINEIGIYYSSPISFKTPSGLIDITVLNPTWVGASEASIRINYDNYSNVQSTEWGICYAEHSLPTVDDNIVLQDEIYSYASLTKNISGLSENTLYYYRGYAKTTEGISYSDVAQIYTYNQSPPPIDFVLVEGGQFEMGSESGHDDEKPVHSVTLDAFEISSKEVTIGQFLEFVRASPPPDGHFWSRNDPFGSTVAYFHYDDYNESALMLHYVNEGVGYFVSTPLAPTPDFPMIYVTYDGAKAFCEWVGGRLPTEAEWEYVARGGAQSNNYVYSGSDILDGIAWYKDNSNGVLHLSGGLIPNELGVYDMTGNVAEICQDFYKEDYYFESSSINPTGPLEQDYVVVRGGSFLSNAEELRVSRRESIWYDAVYSYGAKSAGRDIGFRVVRDVSQ